MVEPAVRGTVPVDKNVILLSRMAVTELHAEVVLDACADVGEGATWDPGRQELLWVDIPRGAIHRYDPVADTDRVRAVGQAVGAVAVRERGGLVAAAHAGFAVLDEDGFRIVAEVETDRPANRMNDGRVDRGGRFWAGTMALDMAPGAGALYRLDRDHGVQTILTGLSVPNGIDWSDDEMTMYLVDSGTRRVDAFAYEPATGAIAGRTALAEIDPDDGMPDGMTLDAQGFLWVAVWGGWAVRRYSPNGTLDAVLHLPASQVTSCAFGGPDLGDLYVTTASADLSARERAAQPLAGALFRCRPGVFGRTANLFRG